MSRSSRLEVFCRKGGLGNFAKFTGKDLCQSLFFNKVAGLRTHFLTEFIWWLLLESNVRETNIKGGKSGEIAGDECRTFYFFNDTINIKNAPSNIKRNGKPYKTILITVII